MRYVLVDKNDNIVYKTTLTSNIGISGARTYFIGIKRIDEEKFDELWSVMTQDEYDKKLEMGLRKPSSHGQVEWWNDDDDYLDIDR